MVEEELRPEESALTRIGGGKGAGEGKERKSQLLRGGFEIQIHCC